MPWNYKHNPTLEIVEVAYRGTITARDLRDSTSELIALQKRKGLNRFLVDTTEMELDASLADVYDLPAKQYEEEGADREGQLAIILPASPREKEAVQFYETTCKNRGWKVHAFSDRQGAISWLAGSSSSCEPEAGEHWESGAMR